MAVLMNTSPAVDEKVPASHQEPEQEADRIRSDSMVIPDRRMRLNVQ